MARLISPEIIYEDTDIIVCRKPAGVPTQSARIGVPDMVSILKTYLASSLREKTENSKGRPARSSGKHQPGLCREPYIALIHRLDQPVEGLLVFAKTSGAARELNRQLTGAGFGKYYRAVVMGIPDPPEGTLEDYIVKDGRTNTSRICTKDTPGAKRARLFYRTEKIYHETSPVTSLLDIRLDTGRHHQIRVQMAHLGCPLAGDRKYGSPSAGGDAAYKKGTECVKLCAYRLEFNHPRDGRKMIFELPY